MIYRHRSILGMVLIAALGLMGKAVAQQQRTAPATPPDFFVRRAESKSIFITMRLFRPESLGVQTNRNAMVAALASTVSCNS